jgi:uncharacterized membrane protein YkgB
MNSMTGVTILDTIPMYSVSGWQVSIAILICVIGLLISFSLKKQRSQTYGAIITMATALITLSIFALYPSHLDVVRYRVRVDDSVGINEFMSKYEIINSSNDIYIVEEK